MGIDTRIFSIEKIFLIFLSDTPLHTSILFPSLSDQPVGLRSGLIFIALISLLVLFGMYTGLGLYIALLIVGTALLIIIVRFPFVWIVSIILGYIPILWMPSISFTPLEAIHAVLFYGGLAWWFFNRFVIQRKTIQWSLGEITYIFFFFYLLFLIPISIGYGGDQYIMMREIAVLSSILLFIPIKYEVKSVKQGKILFSLFVLMLIAFAAKNIAMYKQKALLVYQFWQIGASREAETAFMLLVLTLIAVALIVCSKKVRHQLWWMLIFVVSLVACILTFYRTIWFLAMVGIVIMGFFVGKIYWARLLRYVLLACTLGVLGFQFFLSDTFSITDMASSISERFLTTKKLSKDKSLMNRQRETDKTLDQLGWNVILGHGLGTEVRYNNLIDYRTVRTTWTHNAYPWMLYHFGIIGSLLLLTSIFSFIWKGFAFHKKLRAIHYHDFGALFQVHVFVVTGLTILLSVLLFGWTINPWLGRSEFIVIALVYAFYEIVDRELPRYLQASGAQPIPA